MILFYKNTLNILESWFLKFEDCVVKSTINSRKSIAFPPAPNGAFGLACLFAWH